MPIDFIADEQQETAAPPTIDFTPDEEESQLSVSMRAVVPEPGSRQPTLSAPDIPAMGQPLPNTAERLAVAQEDPVEVERSRMLETPLATLPAMAAGVTKAIAPGLSATSLSNIPAQAATDENVGMAVAPSLGAIPPAQLGTGSAVKGMAEGMTSRAGLATVPYMAVGGAGGAAARIAAGAFGVMGAEGLAHTIPEMGRAVARGDIEASAKAAAESLINSSMIAGGIKAVLPRTAAAVARTVEYPPLAGEPPRLTREAQPLTVVSGETLLPSEANKIPHVAAVDSLRMGETRTLAQGANRGVQGELATGTREASPGSRSPQDVVQAGETSGTTTAEIRRVPNTPIEVEFNNATIDATEALRDKFDSKRRTAHVFKFPEDEPVILYRGISQQELDVIRANPDTPILGGKYSTPLEREYGAQWAATPEEAMRAAFHDEKSKGVQGQGKYLIATDARGETFAHLDPKPTTTPELVNRFRYVIDRSNISGNLGVSVKVPFAKTLWTKEIVREGKGYRTVDTGAVTQGGATVGVAETPTIVGMGGAVPSEFAPVSKTATGIKNATIEKERFDRGLPSAIEPARKSFGRVWDEAMALIDRAPETQDLLLAELRKKPRALTDVEDAMLLHRQIDLQNEYGKATRDLSQAFDDGRMHDVEVQKARVGELSDQLLDLYNIDKAAGTETGRGLAARKMMVNEDFTLAKMEVDLRAAKGGKPLTEPERAELTKTAAEFERISKELETKLAEKDRLLAEANLARTTAEMQAAVAKERATLPPHVKRIVERLGQTLDSRADAARKRLAGKLFSLSPDVLKDLAEIGASNIYHVGMDLTKWSAKMVADLGERVRPHLETIWEASKKLLDDVTDSMTVKAPPAVRQKAKDTVNAKPPETPKEPPVIQPEKGKKRTPQEEKLDEEAFDLRFKQNQLQQEWKSKLQEESLAEENIAQKAVKKVFAASVTTRAIVTSPDWSAVLRQGIYAFTHPKRVAYPGLQRMAKAFFSEKEAFRQGENLQNRANYARYNAAGLKLGEHGQKLLTKEEPVMMSSWIEDPVPKWFKDMMPQTADWAKKLNPVAASARAFTSFINSIRADSFDVLTETLQRRGHQSLNGDKVIANWINVITGRGATIKQLEAASSALNALYFAPRFVLSRLQVAVGQPLWHGVASGLTKGTSAARVVVATEYLRMLLGYATVYGLASAFGYKVGSDINSSDFGKIIIGKIRLDPLAGLSQVLVFGHRAITGKRTSITGKVTKLRGKGSRPGHDVQRLVWDFQRYKWAPWPSAIMDLASGKDALNRPVTPGEVGLRLITPMTGHDIYKVLKSDATLPEKAILSLMAWLGASVQTYDEEKRK